MKNLPKKIYLQVDPQPYGYKTFEEACKQEEVNWCEDKINNNDVEYVLSELQQTVLEQPGNKVFSIDFVVWLVGHDRETIEQMFSDWEKRQ